MARDPTPAAVNDNTRSLLTKVQSAATLYSQERRSSTSQIRHHQQLGFEMRSTQGIDHFQATESMHDNIVLDHAERQFSVAVAGDLQSPVMHEEEVKEEACNVKLSEAATINGGELIAADKEVALLPPSHSSNVSTRIIRPEAVDVELIRTGNCSASPVAEGRDEVDVAIRTDTKEAADSIVVIGEQLEVRDLHENEVLELGKKATNGNAASIGASSKAQSLAGHEIMGVELDLLLHHVEEGCSAMAVDFNGAVNNLMEIPGQKLGIESRASDEQHAAADEIMTEVTEKSTHATAVGLEELAVKESCVVVYQTVVSVESGNKNGALPAAGEAAADAQVKIVDAMDGVEMHKEKLIAGEVNDEAEVMIDVEHNHDNNEEVIVLKQSGSVHASVHEAFSGGAELLGITDMGDDGVDDSHGRIKPVVLPENAKTVPCIMEDGAMEEDGRPATDGIALQPTSRSHAIATMEIDQDSKEAMTLSTAGQAVKEQPAQELHLEGSDATVLNLAARDPVMGSGQPVSSVETESGKLSTLDEVLIATTCARSTEAMTGVLQVHVSRGSDDNLLEGLDVWGIKPRKRKRPSNSKLTLGQPDAAATTSGPLVDLPVTSAAPTHLVNAVATYGNSVAVREDLSGFESAAQVREHQPHVNADRHLEQAQTSAQEAMATATSALAQSQIVWARIHSHNPSDSGTAREVKIASLAATVAAAASVAKAAIEAARALGQTSNEAYLQSDVRHAGPGMQGSLGSGVVPSHLPFETTQAGDEHVQQVASRIQFGKSTKRAITEIHQNVEMLEPMVRAAGLAAQAATYAGAMMTTGNPLTQATSMANYWMGKVAELKAEANQNGKGQAHKKTKLTKHRGVEEIFSRTGVPKKQVGHAGSFPMTIPKKKKDKQVLHARSPSTTTSKKVKDKQAPHTGSPPMMTPKKVKDKQALHTGSPPMTTLKKVKDKQAFYTGSPPMTTPKKVKDEQGLHTGSLPMTTPKKVKDKQALHTGSPPTTTPKKVKDKQTLHTESPPMMTPKKVKDKQTLDTGSLPMTTPRKTMDKKASSKRGVFMKGKEVVQGKAEDMGKSLSPKHSPSKQKVTAISEMTPRYAALQLAGFATQRLDPGELVGWSNINNNPEIIREGSVVEVMSEEEGLRGGWFSAKLLAFTEQEALVVYDELLTDDGSSNLKEWFPRNESFVGSGILRRMRPMHPFVFIKDKGSRIRRRVAMGSQAWSVGDRVDAFLQDGWWEGVVKEVSDMDENKITVYFPGEDDTAVVKTWNVRPSLTWKDGIWGPWTDTWNHEDGHQPPKLQKLENPGVKGKKMAKKRKLMELREDAPETSAPPGSTPRLPEGISSRGVSHAPEVSSTALSTPKHKASYAGMTTMSKSAKKHLTSEIRTPTTRQQSAAENDDHQKPRRALQPTSRLLEGV